MGAKLTTEQFISRSIIQHGNRYNYEKSIYTKQYDHIIIICSEHGEFSQVAKQHMTGCGCPKCGKDSSSQSRTKTSDSFICDSKKTSW